MVGPNQGNTRQGQPVYPNLIDRQTLTQHHVCVFIKSKQISFKQNCTTLFDRTMTLVLQNTCKSCTLGLKGIGRLMETRDGQLTLQGGTDYCKNIATSA